MCSLVTVDLNTAPLYAAISHVWGNPNDTVIITIDGKYQPVTVNLRDILQRLRHNFDARILWADAVCINQEDLEERAQQMQLMSLIFSKADYVVAWRGKDDGGAEEVSALIHSTAMYVQEQTETFGGMANVPEIPLDDLARFKNSTWTLLGKLLQRPFFTRCWIIQEIYLAKTIVALCEDAIIDWDESLMLSIWIAIKREVLWQHFNLEIVLQISTIMLPCQAEITEGRNTTNNFINTLSRGRSYQASNARDKIYAFLSHPCAVWGNKLIVQPDYTKTVRELYIEVALQILKHTGDFSILANTGNKVQ